MKRVIPPSLIAVLFCVCALGATAQTVITNIVMVPRLTIESDAGSTNQIQYSTDLTNWFALTNLLVGQSPYQFLDEGAPHAPHRFYRIVAYPYPLDMAFIPAVSFLMGDLVDGLEIPVHSVYVSAFYMDKHEVSKAKWDAVHTWATNNGYSFDNAGSGKATNHPAQRISWYDAIKWCNARSEKDGRTPAYYTSADQLTVYRTGQIALDNASVKWNAGYRLPTEAEWEKGARGGLSGRRFPLGDTISQNQANYPGNSSAYTYDLGPYYGPNPTLNDGIQPLTSPVGNFVPNGYGLHDMAGNVAEWCWDWYGAYGAVLQTDPHGPSSGSSRVLRGGRASGAAIDCRAASRSQWPPHGSYYEFGFRTVLPAGQP